MAEDKDNGQSDTPVRNRTSETVWPVDTVRKLDASERGGLAFEIIKRLPDEYLYGLAVRITKKLRDEGLEYVHDSLGVSRFLYLPTRVRKEIEGGKKVKVKDGGHTIFYNTKPGEDAVAVMGKNTSDLRHTGSHNDWGKAVYVSVGPETIGSGIARVMNGTDSDFESEGRVRVHECAHTFNAKMVWYADGGGYLGTTPDILREVHSCMVSQLGDSDEQIVGSIAPSITSHIEEARRLYGDKASIYINRYLRHRETAEDPHANEIGVYAVNLIWRLRALGLDDRQVGEQIRTFQVKVQAYWDEKDKACPKIEAWMAKETDKRGTSEEELAGKVLEVKAKYRSDYLKTRKIISEEAVDFCSAVDIGTQRITVGTLELLRGRLPFESEAAKGKSGIVYDISLGNGFDIKVRKIDFIAGTITSDKDTGEQYRDFYLREFLRDTPNGTVENGVSKALHDLGDKRELTEADTRGLVIAREALTNIRLQREEWQQGIVDQQLGAIEELLAKAPQYRG